ncbi:PIN-like domain-containing protein [Micromonospora sp. SCSIO 07396]
MRDAVTMGIDWGLIVADSGFGDFKNFPGWLPPTDDRANFFTSATIVLDANVLLALYRISPTARAELLAILREVKERVWVPHQVALEFMRNREKVIADRNSRFTEVRRAIQSAPERAASEIYAAVDGLNKLRTALVTSGDWNEEQHGLTVADLKKKAAELLKPALVELDRVKSDYDLKHSDIQNGHDEVLRALQQTLSGRIGKAYSPARTRELIEEAINFRYPNEIPPGYLDLKTKSPARAAGDFILWTQLIEMLKENGGKNPLVALVTADAKPDWWQLNGKNEPEKARPELVQELYDRVRGKLLLLNLDDFLEGSRNYLKKAVSPSTVAEAREVIAEEREEEHAFRKERMRLNQHRDELAEALKHIVRDTEFLHRQISDIEARRQHVNAMLSDSSTDPVRHNKLFFEKGALETHLLNLRDRLAEAHDDRHRLRRDLQAAENAIKDMRRD